MTRPGEQKFTNLFQPGQIGPFRTPNRVKYGACCVSNYGTRDGWVTPRELARTKVIAETGCGIITNQGVYPDAIGEGKAYYRQIGLYDDKFIPQFETIAGYIHDGGAVAIQQILHCGRYGGIDLGYALQPSAVPQTLPHFRPPREATKEDIKRMIADHVAAGRRAIKAGFNGVEIPSFIGYLLANWNSKFTNRRTDEYGGSVENRGRFMRELIYAFKEALGDQYLVIVRLPGAELMDQWGGNTEDECLEFIKMAADCGADMISVTSGWQESPVSSIGRDVPPGHWNRLAARAKRLLPETPVAFGVRLPDPSMADACIANGEFDFWELCRPLLADPELLQKTADDRAEEIKPCIGDMLCLSRLFRDLPYQCTCNPVLGHEVEPEYHVTPSAVSKKIMVIGAGPAGMEFALTATRRGHEVTVFDGAEAIGGNLVGYANHDLANKADLFRLVGYYEIQAKRLGVQLQLQTNVEPKLLRSALPDYDVAVVAAGASVPLENVPSNSGDIPVLDAHQVARRELDIGERVVIFGGGKVGLVLGESLADRGVRVTIVEEQKRIAGDVLPTWKWRHTAWVEQLKITVLTSTRLRSLGDDGVTVENNEGEEMFLPADTVIMASPRQSNQNLFGELEYLVDEVYLIGDAMAPRGLQHAIHDGYRLGVRV